MGRAQKKQVQQTSRTETVAPCSAAQACEHTTRARLPPPLRKETSSEAFPAALPSSLAGATWQGILWCGGRPVGRLVSPDVEWSPVLDHCQEAGGQLYLHFSRVVLVPAAAAATSAGAGSQVQPAAQPACEPLHLLVDEEFAGRSLRVQVFGRQPSGANFAAPHAFRAEGRDLAAALDVQRQWQEYQQRHQAARASAGQPVSESNFAHSSTLAVQSGDGLERLQAIFDVAGGTWLKGIVCRLLVADASEQQPGATDAVDGTSGCGAGLTEQGGAAAAQAGTSAEAALNMAAPLTAAAGSKRGPGSWKAAGQHHQQPQWQELHEQQPKQQQLQLQERRRGQRAPLEHQAPPREQQQQPAAQAPKVPASLAGAAADGTMQQHPTSAPRDGKTKRPGSRQAARKASHDVPAVGGDSSAEGIDTLLPASDGWDCAAEHPALSAAGNRGSSVASAGQPASPPAPRNGKAAAVARHAAHPTSWQVSDEPSSGPGGAAGGRSGSRGSGRPQRSPSQEASFVRRHPKLFPGVDQQASTLPPAGSSQQLVQERGRLHSSTAAAQTLARPAAGRPGPGSDQQSSSTAGSASSSHAGPGRGQKGAPAGRAELAPPAGDLLPPWAAGRAVPRLAERSHQQPHAGKRASEAQSPAACFLDLVPPTTAACDCGCNDVPAMVAQPQHSISCSGPWPATQALSPPAPVWQGAADSADVAAEAAAAAAAQAACQQPVWQGAADSSDVAAEAAASATAALEGGSGSSSRPSTPADGECSECSEGSRSSHLSWQSSDGIFLPTRPSEWGLSYNYGHPCPLPFTMWEPQIAGVVQHGHAQHAPPPPPPAQRSAPLGEAAGRSSRRSAAPVASAANSRSGSLAGSTSGGSACSMPAPLHRGAASTPLLTQPSYHRRSGSGCSQASVEGGTTAPAPAPALVFRPTEQHWLAHSLSSWPEGFVAPAPQQPFVPLYVRPIQPSPFLMRMHAAPARPPWAQQQLQAQQRLNGAEPAADAFWQLHRRNSSSSLSGWQQHAEAAQQHKPRVAARGVAASDGSGSGHLSMPPPFSPAVSARSAPASAAASPTPSRALPSGMPSSIPPPPPPVAPSVDLQVPESAEDGPDLERFLRAATPQVLPPPSGLQDLTLADLWRWYEGPSTLGCEIPTIGGPRGPATAYYLPYLSAIQLFVPATAADEAAAAAAVPQPGSDAQPPPQLLSYPDGLDSWPERMRPAVQWGEAANMRDRVPLHSRLLDLCGQAGEQHPLMATRIADLHPFSWFAVAWYPLYCVPEAPLTARFLTFHTLAGLWEAASEAAAKCRQRQEAALVAASAEVQRQWLQAAAEVAAGGGGEAQATAYATPPRLAAARSPGMQASPGGASPGRGPPSRPSYKSMLEAGLPAAEQPPMRVTVTYTATPTAVCSFPGSPTCSDAGTRTTLDTGSSRAHSVDGGGGSGAAGSSTSAPARSRLLLSSGAGSVAPTSSVGDCSSSTGHPASLAASAASSAPPSPPASVAGDSSEPMPVPVAGLAWYAAGRDENWTETLVPAQLPAGTFVAPGTVLASGMRLLGSWRGVAVLERPYPVAKGGPLGWEIQQEEMAQCAERLASGAGLVALRPRLPGTAGSSGGNAAGGASVEWEPHGQLSAASLGVSCPDYEFFAARSAQF